MKQAQTFAGVGTEEWLSGHLIELPQKDFEKQKGQNQRRGPSRTCRSGEVALRRARADGHRTRA